MIKLAKSSFYKEKQTKKALVNFISKAEIFSMDVECRKFEEAFAKKQGRKYAVLVSSGSMANLVLIQALMNMKVFKPGDKIGFSALTWATNVMPILQFGLVPVALDVSLNTFNVTPEEVEKNAKSMKGLFITNVLGLCDDLPKIQKICKKYGIVFLEDNCESLGSKIKGKLLGNFGLASTFSFFVGHHLSTVEGGMICTDDEKLHEMLVMVRAHGWDRNLAPHKQEKLRRLARVDNFYAKYTFHDMAYNARPTEITGFLGHTQLPLLNQMIEKRRRNFHAFAKEVNKNDHFIPIKFDHLDLVSNMAMPVILKTKELANKYKDRFHKFVEIRPVIAGNIINQPFYKKYLKKKSNHKNADFIHAHGFYFANNPELTRSEINLILSLLKK